MFPGWIFEPRNRGSISSYNPFVVHLDVGQVINLEAYAALPEFVYRFVDILNREIQDGKSGRCMIRPGVDKNVIASGNVQPQQAIRFRNLYPKCVAIEFLRLLDVIDRKNRGMLCSLLTLALFRLLLVHNCSACSMATLLEAESERELWVSYCRLFIGTVPKRKTANISGGSLSNPNCRRLRR